jgi:sensor histidine kinase YesM
MFMSAQLSKIHTAIEKNQKYSFICIINFQLSIFYSSLTG